MTPAEIRERRKQLGLTQAELAERLGVSRNAVVRWERGLNAIDAPRSLWLDVEMAKVKRKTGRPKQSRRRRAAEPPAREGEGHG